MQKFKCWIYLDRAQKLIKCIMPRIYQRLQRYSMIYRLSLQSNYLDYDGAGAKLSSALSLSRERSEMSKNKKKHARKLQQRPKGPGPRAPQRENERVNERDEEHRRCRLSSHNWFFKHSQRRWLHSILLFPFLPFFIIVSPYTTGTEPRSLSLSLALLRSISLSRFFFLSFAALPLLSSREHSPALYS